MEKNSGERRSRVLTPKKIAAVAAGALTLLGLERCTGYDNDAHPTAGIVVQHSKPDWECKLVGKIVTCGWEYWLYVDGCQEISPATEQKAREQDADYQPEKGWVEVSGSTWSRYPDGSEIIFSEQNLLNSIEIYIPGIDSDYSEPCN